VRVAPYGARSDALPPIVQNRDFRAQFGRRLKDLRKQKGYTQKELADRIGVRQAQLNKYEGGSNAPSLEKLVELAEVLEVSADYLLAGDQSAPRPLHNIRLWDRFRNLQALPSDDVESAIKVLDALIAQSHAALHARERESRRRRAQR
jgi:transcriptional regulator with XRE-family HTH domain